MHIPDEQLDLFAQRLSAIGVGRRDFLKVVGAMAAFGGLGFATEARAASPTKPAPGEKLAKEQVFRYGGGGYFQNDPASHDFNKDLYCSGEVHILILDDDPSVARIMQTALSHKDFQIDVMAEPTHMEAQLQARPYHIVILDYILTRVLLK